MITPIRLCVMSMLFAVSAGAEEPQTLSLGQRFHLETSFGYEGSKTLEPRWGRKLAPFKLYDDAERISLPQPRTTNMPVDEAIGKRHSMRSFSPSTIPLDYLTRVLHSAYGITQSRDGLGHRGVPSAGGLFPIEIYVLAARVDSLAAGIYHFQASDTTLELVREGDFSAAIHEAANNQEAVASMPVALVIAARFDRTTWKYADRGYRYVYIEAGAVCQNVYLQATALDMGTCAVGAFNDEALSALLEIDGIDEAPLLIMPLGFPAGG